MLQTRKNDVVRIFKVSIFMQTLKIVPGNNVKNIVIHNINNIEN